MEGPRSSWILAFGGTSTVHWELLSRHLVSQWGEQPHFPGPANPPANRSAGRVLADLVSGSLSAVACLHYVRSASSTAL